METVVEKAQPEPLSLAYIAGFFDGEGCIMLTRSKKGRERPATIILHVTLTQADRDILELIREFLGGMGSIQPHPGGLGSKPCYALHWSDASAETVLRMLMPWLRIKRGKAQVALDFRKLIGRQGVRTDSNVLALREGFREKLREA